MKILIKKASDYKFEEIKEVNTLEEMLEISSRIIIDTDGELDFISLENQDFDAIVTIYDDWIE